jgi:two-component system, chemotaxis family, protein-glutamate methylesterase/glutaminase
MANSEHDLTLTQAAFEVVVLGASAGGLNALRTVTSCLPASFPAPLLAVQHMYPSRPSMLAEILSRSTRLRVRQAQAGAQLEPGVLYLAPPDWHLVVDEARRAQLSHAARQHHVRPSVDVLFESVARAFGPRAVAIILSGSGRDGDMGVRAIKSHGGTVIVEDPKSAAFAGMPEAAILTGSADYVLALGEIGPALLGLVVPGA